MSSVKPPPPRLYVLPATGADVAVVFRRGPGRWWLVSRWDLATGALEAGPWFRGTLYPRRSDVSPDGRFLTYFALKMGLSDFCGPPGVKTFIGLSRVPWLTAIAAWQTPGTWTGGAHFSSSAAGEGSLGMPDHGDARPLPFVLAATGCEQYAAERRRGWQEHPECPPRAVDDRWDERRHVVLVRERPTAGDVLVLTDTGWQSGAPDRIEGRRPTYRIERGRQRIELPDVTWADWDRRGRLIVAIETGHVQIREGGDPTRVLVDHDLRDLVPARRPSPAAARRW